MIKANDICLVKHPLGKSKDMRPCIVLEVHGDIVKILLISSALDLYVAKPKHFLLDSLHQDFSMTGLQKTSFIIGDQIFSVKIEKIEKKIGEISGELAKVFHTWIG